MLDYLSDKIVISIGQGAVVKNRENLEAEFWPTI